MRFLNIFPFKSKYSPTSEKDERNRPPPKSNKSLRSFTKKENKKWETKVHSLESERLTLLRTIREKELEVAKFRKVDSVSTSEKNDTKSRASQPQSTVEHHRRYIEKETGPNKSRKTKSSRAPQTVTHKPFLPLPPQVGIPCSRGIRKQRMSSGVQLTQTQEPSSYVEMSPNRTTALTATSRYLDPGKLTVKFPSGETFKLEAENLSAYGAKAS